MAIPYARPLLAALSFSLAAISLSCGAQDASNWPSKNISIVRITNPGTGPDLELRLWAERLSADLGKPVVFDFRAGASGVIGTSYVAKAAPDGYTFLAASTSFSVAPAFDRKLPYNVVKDFIAISQLFSNTVVLMANASFPPNNLTEYVAYAKANPGGVLWADSGTAAMNYLSGVMLHRLISAEPTFIHYTTGGAQIFPDLLSGRVNVYPASTQNAVTLMKSGKTKPLFTMSLQRDKQLADVRTAHEQGYTDFEQPNYYGLVGPAGMSPAIVDKFYGAIARAAKHPSIMKLESEGNIIVASRPAEFQKYIATQVARWTKLVDEIGLPQ